MRAVRKTRAYPTPRINNTLIVCSRRNVLFISSWSVDGAYKSLELKN